MIEDIIARGWAIHLQPGCVTLTKAMHLVREFRTVKEAWTFVTFRPKALQA